MSPSSNQSSIWSCSLVLAACLVAMVPAGTAHAAEPVAVTVQQFELSGNQAIASDVLQQVLQVWVKRQLSQADLARAAQAVTDTYTDRGLLARAFLPQQDVTGGVVRIRVQESRFGQIRVLGGATRAISEKQATGILLASQKPGEIVRLVEVDRALGVLAEWPGLHAKGDLVKGSADGQTDLVLTLSETAPTSFALRLDNEGARATGEPRLSMNAAWLSPAGMGEILSINAVASQGSKLLRIAAETPVDSNGLRASLYGSVLDYQLTAPEFDVLSVKGPSRTAGMSLRWPAVRTALRTSDLSAQLEQRAFQNDALGTTLSNYHINALNLNWSDQFPDLVGPNARVMLDANVTVGRVDLTGSPNEAADAQTTRTAGDYQLARFSLQRLQTLTAGRYWWLKVSGQVANRNLDSTERLPIAGPHGVRAYPVGEVSGSEGWVLSNELRQNFGGIGQPQFTAALFGDVGFGSQLVDPNFTGAPVNNSLRIKGAGLWLEWRSADKPMSARLTWARRVGSHPNLTNIGTNQDGSTSDQRVWLSAEVTF